MNKEQEEKKMINKIETTKTVTVSDDIVMMLAKKGAKKYRKALDKLAKN